MRLQGYEVCGKYMLRGMPVSDTSMFYRAWDEFIELQVVDRETWVSKTCADLQELNRFEVSVKKHGSDEVIAAAVFVEDDDPHVRRCFSVLTQYVTPEHRHRGISAHFMRAQRRLAKDFGYSVLAWTHRVRDWRYETIYRRLK